MKTPMQELIEQLKQLKYAENKRDYETYKELYGCNVGNTKP